jgi:lipid A 3-O-deacylase PagL
MRLRAATTALLLIVGLQVQAQYKLSSFELSTGPGFTFKTHPDFPEINERSFVTSFVAGGKLNGSKPWHKNYHHPYLSFQTTYASLGNKSVLGNYVGVMTDLTFAKELNKGFSLECTGGMGVAWFSKPYNEISNPENIVIGSAVTFSANISAALVKKISEVSSLQFKAMMIHASNSHFQLPNLGLNLPTLQIGYRYRIPTSINTQKDTIVIPKDKSWRATVRLSLGMNEQGETTSAVNGPKYPIYLVTFYMSRKLSPINKVYVGLEYYFNTGVKDFIISQKFYKEKVNKRSSVIALTFGHEFLLGHFSMVTTLGVNIYNKFYQDRLNVDGVEGLKPKIKSYVPARIGFQYYLKDATIKHAQNIYFGVYIKSNLGQADFLESGIGYTF